MNLNFPVEIKTQFTNQTLTLQTGRLAKQATSSVTASLGGTTIMASVVVGKKSKADFFPLQVIFEEKFYASGKIKSSRFDKREGKPPESAVLAGRMIDRSLRSLFDDKIRNDIQIIITVLSLDEINSPDTLAVIAASSALMICGIKEFRGPVSAVRIGLKNSEIKPKLNKELLEKTLEAIYKAENFAEIKPILENFYKIYGNTEEYPIQKDKLLQALTQKSIQWVAQYKLLEENTDPNQNQENKTFEAIVNPNYKDLETSMLDLVVSGDEQNIYMLEAGAKIIDEETISECLDLASKSLLKLNQIQIEFLNQAKEKGFLKNTEIELKPYPQIGYKVAVNLKAEIFDAYYFPGNKMQKEIVIKKFRDDLKAIFEEIEKGDLEPESKLKEKILIVLKESISESNSESQINWEEMEDGLEIVIKEMFDEQIFNFERRFDGRALNQTRQIFSNIGVLPLTHGSSLFERGETQVLNILTLGTMRDAQTMDDMEDFEENSKRYIHHYNFPPYSVGETGRYGPPKRREIGHGALAEKALLPVLPSEDEFPYTMRLVSECLGSNGSTSMASTCGSCLSLLDGGVPIKDLVAGVAMGLAVKKETGEYKLITDILGMEDHFGSMDFKVTGTQNGITAIQLDNKTNGLNTQILKKALIESKKARLHILGIMKATISAPRKNLSANAPRVLQTQIPINKIGDVIGASGKIIKDIIARTETEIDIENETGKVYIYAKESQKAQLALKEILARVKEYQVGETVSGKIFRIEAFGAFVKLDDTGKEGMIHISEISYKRTEKVEDELSIGQIVNAKIIKKNEKGQLNLSIKALQEKPIRNISTQIEDFEDLEDIKPVSIIIS